MVDVKRRLIIALDGLNFEQAKARIDELANYVGGFKVGFEMITKGQAIALAQYVAERYPGLKLFYDGKFCDIPQTVANATAAVCEMPAILMLNVHCMGGKAMMKAAREAVDKHYGNNPERPLVIGVTILTSLGYDALVEIGFLPSLAHKLLSKGQETLERLTRGRIQRRVVKLALLAKEAGLDGVVASPREITAIRKACGPDFKIVTPGIRSKDAPPDDQARTMPAGEAVVLGADYLVVGRPILKPADGTPAAAAQRLCGEVHAALTA